MQFTYSFPPLLRLGYDIITDAMAADKAYVPGNGATGRVDTWRQWSRWKRVSCIINNLSRVELLHIVFSNLLAIFVFVFYRDYLAAEYFSRCST